MARSEPSRHWTFTESDLDFPHRFLRGMHRKAASSSWHVNFEIINRLRRSRPNVLLVAGSWTLPTVWLAALTRAGGTKIFWSESHLESVQHRGWLANLVRRFVLGTFKEFVVPGRLAKEYVEANAHSVRFHHLPNLVNPTLFRARVRALRGSGQQSADQDRRTLLLVARLAPEKGILQFIQGIRLLSKDERLRLRIVIAGDGPERRRLQEQALDLGVVLAGHKSEEELIGLYAEANGFCLPSLSDPNPLAVIEALWAGLPLLLSSRVGNHPECLVDRQNGFLFDSVSADSIAAAVSRWLALSPEELSLFGNRSLEIAEREFNPEAAIARFLDRVLPGVAPAISADPRSKRARHQAAS